jgi:hypothetical protein
VRSNPCPSTGRTSGGCPGYVVDHVTPLKRGGVDTPSNMQRRQKRQRRLRTDRVKRGCPAPAGLGSLELPPYRDGEQQLRCCGWGGHLVNAAPHSGMIVCGRGTRCPIAQS